MKWEIIEIQFKIYLGTNNKPEFMSQKEIHSLPDEEIIISMRPFLPLFK